MEIITKYNINQTVWLMFKNKPLETKIRSLKVTICMNQSKVHYSILYSLDMPEGADSNDRLEDNLFSSKQKLLDSL